MKKGIRIVFMGTPDFAVEPLKALLKAGENIVGVITAPGKPAGRGQQIQSPPVKIYAESAGITNILQPGNLKSPEFLEQLHSLKPDLQIVVAFRMLPEVVWTLPPKGTVNLHASLLPDYRGAAPINWAIINGEKITGLTTFFIERSIDTGNIILTKKVEITPEMTAGELHDLLMFEGAKLLVETVKNISDGTITAVPQSDLMKNRLLHPAPKIFKDDCLISWYNEGKKIYDFIRGLSPYPAAWTILKKDSKEMILKIFKAAFYSSKQNMKPGTIISDKKNYLKIAVTDGFIEILEIQQAGKKRMIIAEFLRGIENISLYNLVV